MLEIRNTEVFGLSRALVASGNPMRVGEIDTLDPATTLDDERARKLCKMPDGSGHLNFLSGITVMFDVKYSQYWSIEFQRYHFAQIVSSTSKMHRLVAHASTDEFAKSFNKYVDDDAINRVRDYVTMYSNAADPEEKYHYFMKALSNLPLGYELWMTINTNYLQLRTIYHQRKNHKLKDDWGYFCNWVEELPLARMLLL
jgi:hypothetical protein